MWPLAEVAVVAAPAVFWLPERLRRLQ